MTVMTLRVFPLCTKFSVSVCFNLLHAKNVFACWGTEKTLLIVILLIISLLLKTELTQPSVFISKCESQGKMLNAR